MDAILIIGGTGMLGRPVVRRLCEDGARVRVLVRDEARARAVLPPGCELVRGDLREQTSLESAMRGAAAVYLNLAAPMLGRAPEYCPERDGTRAAVDAARAVGVPRLLRISAMGVDEAAPRWWAARHKLEADRAVMQSGIPYTVFRPTWFMESIATTKLGRMLLEIGRPETPLRWLAGDDYARQVAAALGAEASKNHVYHPQGPELLSIDGAFHRFAAAFPGRLWQIHVPGAMVRALGMVSGKAAYLRDLLVMTEREFARIDAQPIATDLPASTMTIEDYVGYLVRTGDRPSK